ncbi:Vps52 / Sac2 family [Perilla frutescens var. frutescens]|nr:Vps52 / Sac2 family [Perilla frutescens var. frutescens]
MLRRRRLGFRRLHHDACLVPTPRAQGCCNNFFYATTKDICDIVSQGAQHRAATTTDLIGVDTRSTSLFSRGEPLKNWSAVFSLRDRINILKRQGLTGLAVVTYELT